MRSPASLPPTGTLTLDLELLAEEASALGRAGRRVEETLARLAAATAETREQCLRDAAEAVHHYFILREMRGFRRHDDAVAVYRIPGAVLARLGAS
ncbi:MAG: hypothetical protein GX458_17670 [Phyllobacteriaceae bacterium]|nr:hypothetical protein [Phyllobacteriaceae bacterium]